MRIYLVYLLFVLGCLFNSCGDDPGRIIELTPDQKAKFPQAYYTQDSISIVYSDSLTTDTSFLVGSAVDRYLTVDNHFESGSTMAENLTKTFQSMDSEKTLEITMTTEDYDKYWFGRRLYIKYLKSYFFVPVDKIKNTTEDQVLKSEYGDIPITYNTISGIRKIEVTNVKKPYTLTFLP